MRPVRSTQGVTVMNLSNDDEVVGLAIMQDEEDDEPDDVAELNGDE